MGSDSKESRPNGQEFDVNGPMEGKLVKLTVKNPMTSFSHRCLQHRLEITSGGVQTFATHRIELAL